MPTLMERQLDPAAGAMLQRRPRARAASTVHHRGQHQGDPRHRAASRRSQLADGTRAAGRPRRHGGRHPAEHRARPSRSASRSSAASSSTTSMRTSRPGDLRRRRVRRASRPDLRPGRAALGHGEGLRRRDDRRRRDAPMPARVTGTRLKVTGIDMFSAGDFAGGEGTRGGRVPRPGARRLPPPRAARRPADRRRAVRRRARRRLVFRPAARRRRRSATCATR